MGAAMGVRLIGQGHELTVWNRSAGKTRPLTDLGAKPAATPAEVARRSEAVLTILTDAAAIEAVYGGDGGLLSGDVRGKLFIEMSTVRSETERTLARAAKEKGAAFVECPVGGSTGPAREGKLLGFVGGADADAVRARPILEQLCRRVEHIGPVGARAAMKLAINLPLLVYWQVFGEALSLVRPYGVDPDRLISIFSETSGGPNVLKTRGAAAAAALRGKPASNVTFDLDSMRKDLRTMLEEAKSLGRTLPMVARALEFYDAASRDGWGARDCATLPAYWVERGK